MWNDEKEKTRENAYEKYLAEFLPAQDDIITFPSFEEFQGIVTYLPNWKAAGVDGIYNYFIKNITALHRQLYEVIKRICLNSKTEEEWFYMGITYLLPKGKPTNGGDFRPITCMTNLYKLTTKCVTNVIQTEVSRRGLVCENQLGTVKKYKVQRNRRC